MRHIFTGLIVASMLLMAVAPNALANAHIVDDIPASPITVFSVSVGSMQSKSIETTNLSPGADTVIHVLNSWGDEILQDDDGGMELGSKVMLPYNNSWFGGYDTYTIIVRAYNENTSGTTDIKVGSFVTKFGVPVGGAIRSVPCDAPYQYETAITTNGAEDTYLIGLNSVGEVIALNDNGGVGLASRIDAGEGVCHLVVGAAEGSAAGITRVLVNDAFDDLDNDGLGSALETALGTCDCPGSAGNCQSFSSATPGCEGVYNAKDTDRDGLDDMAEVFGIDDVWDPQYLPRWGADPLHKDVFVEIDFTDFFSSNPIDPTNLETVQALYVVGEAEALQNPDGIDGVNLHFDVGIDPPVGSDASLYTLYGDWGGTNITPQKKYSDLKSTHRKQVRFGVFHYGLADKDGGQGERPGQSFGFGAQGTSNGANTLAHELGHNLNLQHHGTDAWGPANCKPNYKSIMNYALGNTFSQSNSEFSINPNFVMEEHGVGPDVATAEMSGAPYYLDIDGDAVDFNRDGDITFKIPGTMVGWVRAAPTWAPWDSCSALEQNPQTLRFGAGHASTPALIRRKDRLYAFYINADQRIYYRHGLVSGADWNGSCPGGDSLGAECTQWSSPKEVPTALNAFSVSAVTLENDQITIAYQTSWESLRTMKGTMFDSDGNVTAYTPEKWVVGANTQMEPELAIISLDPATSWMGITEVVAMYWRDRNTTNFKWAVSLDGSWWSSAMNVMDSSGAPLTGGLAASVAPFPGDSLPQLCGVFPKVDGELRFHCLNLSSWKWDDLTAQTFSKSNKVTSVEKVGLAYHVYRSWAGIPLFGDPSVGQFQMAVVSKVDGAPKMYISKTLSSLSPPTTHMVWGDWGQIGNKWTMVLPGSGIELYEDIEISALKGLWIHNNDADANGSKDGNPSPRLEFLPLMDGTFEAVLKGGNDFEVMERGICLSLQGQGFCGTANTAVSGL